MVDGNLRVGCSVQRFLAVSILTGPCSFHRATFLTVMETPAEMKARKMAAMRAAMERVAKAEEESHAETYKKECAKKALKPVQQRAIQQKKPKTGTKALQQWVDGLAGAHASVRHLHH